MNKIIVVNNKIIPCDNDDVIVCDNSISFVNSGKYLIEFIDTDEIGLTINVSDGIRIELFEYSKDNDITLNREYNLGKDSYLTISKFFANKGTCEKCDINLKGDRAGIKYNFSSISSGNDRFVININHLAKKTESQVFNRTVAKSKSSNFFDINSYVNNGIKDCYLKQETKIITLGKSNNKINPNMFIGEVSTTAVHSSVVGSINKDDLFYLMARGIDYKTSTNLIIKGIILSNINPDMEMKEKILDILEEIGGE